MDCYVFSPEFTRIAHNFRFYIFMVLEAAQQGFVLTYEREEQSSSGSPRASPQGLVPPRRERPLHHQASLASPDLINAQIFLDASFHVA